MPKQTHKAWHDSFFFLNKTFLSTTDSLLLRICSNEIGQIRESKAIAGFPLNNCEPRTHNPNNCLCISLCTLTENVQVNTKTRSVTFGLFLRTTWCCLSKMQRYLASKIFSCVALTKNFRQPDITYLLYIPPNSITHRRSRTNIFCV